MRNGNKGGAAVLDNEKPVNPLMHEEQEVTMTLRALPLASIAESPLNPRKHFDEAALTELAASLAAHGQLQPVLVRPLPHGVYELAAGHRRFRAAKRAGLATLQAIVRPMDDAAFLEVLTIENLQREDLHPLEEADGYAELIEHLRYDVETIAQRVHRSVRYIYDRLKLRSLHPDVRTLFLNGTLELAHAVELTRIPQDAQVRAIDPTAEAVFARDYAAAEQLAAFDDAAADAADPYATVKLRSVRELKAWIATHVRFDTAADHLALDLPETAERLRQAEAEAAKVVHITYENFVHPDAREGGKVVGPRSWKRADGKPDLCGDDSSPCAHAVLGLVVAGRGRGEAFDVCTAKKTCRVHWAAEMREATRATATPAEAPAASAKAAAPKESAWERQERERKAFAATVKQVREPLLAAFAAAIKKASTAPKGGLERWVTDSYVPHEQHRKVAGQWVPRGTNGDGFMRWLGFARVLEILGNDWSLQRELTTAAKLFGVDLKAILKGATPKAEKTTAKPARKAKRAATAKQAGRRG